MLMQQKRSDATLHYLAHVIILASSPTLNNDNGLRKLTALIACKAQWVVHFLHRSNIQIPLSLPLRAK